MKVVEAQTNCGSLVSGSTVEMHDLAGKGEAGKAERSVCEQAGQGERTAPSKACTAVILLECDGRRKRWQGVILDGILSDQWRAKYWSSTGTALVVCLASRPRPPACLCYHH